MAAFKCHPVQVNGIKACYSTDGQLCRYLLTNPLHKLVYDDEVKFKRIPPMFWNYELHADLEEKDGWQMEDVVYMRDQNSSCHATEISIWRMDSKGSLSPKQSILQVTSQTMSRAELLAWALRKATEVVETRGYQRLHVITTDGVTFRAWLYITGGKKLEYFSPASSDEEFFNASTLPASTDWYKFVQSIKLMHN